jgi:mannose-6-phosphate isomerase
LPTNIYPLRLAASLHETLWGGQRLHRDDWKRLPSPDLTIGESWETEISNVCQNGPYAGRTLGELVDEIGETLLGAQATRIFGRRFPLLAKFIDANAKLSVQVHPNDAYAAACEQGMLGKTECWYILAADAGASIVHGFKATTSRVAVQQAIAQNRLESLLHEEIVFPGDIIFVPAGTVHAIGGGIMLYELQEYSNLTYRMYDYGRLTTNGAPRELHIERSLDVAHYDASPSVKVRAVPLVHNTHYEERCLVACPYFVMRETTLTPDGYMKAETAGSCVIFTSLNAEMLIRYGDTLEQAETLTRGETMVLPAALGDYCIEGGGTFLRSYVPAPDDDAWAAWQQANCEM